MRELTGTEVEAVGGGALPLIIVGIDLALNGVLIAYASYAAMNYHAERRPD